MEEKKRKLLFYALKYKGDWDLIVSAINRKEEIDEKEFVRLIEKLNCKYITMLDSDYPNKFKGVFKPPFVLFYYGDLSLINGEHLLGVVGSREPSEYGIKACKKVLSEINRVNPIIVSGLAKGIDSIAHKIALEKEFKTIAVLGTGIDYCYPKENYSLYKKIKENGLIISEYPYKELVSVTNFALRNRLVAALSDAIFIPDVKNKSGTLITVRFSLEAGKSILVTPTSIFENLYNNRLIYQGATPILCANDIEEEIK